MFKITIHCDEIPRMVELLKQYPAQTDENIIEVFNKMLFEIERDAKLLAPVKTDRLRADIGTKLIQKELEGIVFNTVEYAIYVHEGTYKMTARPYIYNAIFRGKDVQIERELARNYLKTKRGLI